MGTGRSHVFFTSNGEELPRTEGSETDKLYTSWYPAIGVDSYNEVRVNFGQEPFAHDGIVDELFAECDPRVVSASDLPWHYISEYSIDCLVWRRRQTYAARARDVDDWKDAITDEGEAALKEDIFVKKWMVGMLTRRQQNRLASREENANEVRAAAQQLS
ncbi:unnamed protein product [Phytophthora fragariaefolia]|uniref:Unnamed protein product n=1 Tax=Phytophthora fragariaefolia TaxID=1490495 RepID=A0A9W7CPV2_9STRA|nr:unnamed protein product [Phytophthora fragariaefolia]